MVEGLSNKFLTSGFVGGLKYEAILEIKYFSPSSLRDIIVIAKLQDKKCVPQMPSI